MFQQTERKKRSTRAQIASFALHAALIYVAVKPPVALYVRPYTVQLGRGGHSTALVFDGHDRAELDNPEFATPTRHKLAYVPPDAKTIHMRAPDRVSIDKPRKKVKTTVADAARAGAENGSVIDGMLSGPDVRPALPMVFPDPVINRAQIPDGVAGTVVVEVTIDAFGNVTATKILQRVGHGIDEKVEAAVRNWRFHPATMDGRPIPSQQDVLYRFPS